ncbi:protein of unknown function [Methylocella tundrae]|uniref:Uncharacterized protein n=1 Tax=Methylocella tundrae TaxID=227605 RepID=A0A4U8YUU5_METTU|nr:protein of unknown function [Methylocella tundrae]
MGMAATAIMADTTMAVIATAAGVITAEDGIMEAGVTAAIGARRMGARRMGPRWMGPRWMGLCTRPRVRLWRMRPAMGARPLWLALGAALLVNQRRAAR